MTGTNPPIKPGTILAPSNPFTRQGAETLPSELTGKAGKYQLGYTGSPINILLDGGLEIGGVKLFQTTEPFLYQYTDVIKFSIPEPYEAEITRRLWSRKGQFVTIAEFSFTVPPERLDICIENCRKSCESALGALVSLLDERIIDRRIGEFATIESASGTHAIDITPSVRTFHPGIDDAAFEDINAVAGLLLSDPILQSALRFYILGIEQRLTQTGYILLTTCVDMLVGRKRKFNPVDIRTELLESGQRDSDWPIKRIKKIGTVRGSLIHSGMIESNDMHVTWYDLEEIVRILLRSKMKLKSSWGARVPMNETGIYVMETLFDEDPFPDWA